MKKFLRDILLFGIIINVAIEFLLFLRPNEFSYKRAYVEEHINDIKCLLMGDSYIEMGLNPSMMGDGVFNMAIMGRTTIYDVELAKRYVPQMEQLQFLVIPLAYHHFFFGRKIKKETANADVKKKPSGLRETRKCMYYKYMGLRVDGFWYWSELLNSKLDYMSRFFRNDEDCRECDSLGFFKWDFSKRGDNWMNIDQTSIVDTTIEANREEQALLYAQYCTLAELAGSRGAKLVILSTPKYKTFNNQTNPVIKREMEAFVADLKQKYPNVEYYDYSTDERFVDDDFYNANHLSEFGASKFSKIVKEEILDKQKPSSDERQGDYRGGHTAGEGGRQRDISR